MRRVKASYLQAYKKSVEFNLLFTLAKAFAMPTQCIKNKRSPTLIYNPYLL
ncbi:MAG: hypothetical protein IJ776_07015 [Paludibacteraceae bacterium]|nr:hypothetical protein [Paludibacteraceae bacterium]